MLKLTDTARLARSLAVLSCLVLLLGALPLRLEAAPAQQAGSCSVAYTVNQWTGGFTADVTITNGGAALTSWTLTWSFSGDQTISNMWNASYTQSGRSVTAKNMSYNGSLPSGGSQSFGFQASFSGTNAAPTNFALNGTACNGGSGPTATPVPPTATATRTPTGPTATATRTPTGPTATATRTPTSPTATATRTPTGPTATPPPVGDAIYVAPTGSDSAPGTISQPTTLTSAITRVRAGGVIYMRGGTYRFSAPVMIARGNDGTSSARKQLFAYPGETPVLNFSAMAEDPANRGLTVNGFYWHLKGLIVERAGDNGIFVGGNNNIIERTITRFNRDTGIQISRHASSAPKAEWPANNLILSCESHDNRDSGGENADGFAAKLTIGNGNVFRYDVAHNNIDDGWDLYTKTETGAIGPVTIEDSIAHNNGTLSDGSVAGNGDRNGFKLGGESIGVNHIIRRNIAYKNGKHGFTWNRNTGSIEMTANIAIDSTERNFTFEGGTSVFRNNLSCRSSSGSNDKIVGNSDSTNAWWMGSNSSRCSGYTGALSWWYNADGSLGYRFQ